MAGRDPLTQQENHMAAKRINLGDRVKHSITGYQGIAVGRTEYLHGCTSVGVKAEALHDGKTIDIHWFDEPALEVVDTGVYAVDTRVTAAGDKPGGPRPVPSGISV